MRPDNWRAVGEDEVVEFDVHCKMNKAWANELMSFLKQLERFGELGSSRMVALYADGDGDFRPHFDTKFDFTPREPIDVLVEFEKGVQDGSLSGNAYRADYVFDAG